MRTLIMDTSTNLLYISFIENDKVIYEVKTLGLNNHSDHLLNLIEKGLNECNLQVKDFNKIVIGVGPGAYTGLRVSMSVAKMFSWTLNIPLYSISSLDLLTSGYKKDGSYVISFKAKKGYVYSKKFEIVNGNKENISNEEFISLEQLDIENRTVITHDEMNIDCLNIKENECKLVSNIHALEPNYLRDC